MVTITGFFIMRIVIMRSPDELYHSMRIAFESATTITPICWQMSTEHWNLWRMASPDREPFGLPVKVFDFNGPDELVLYYAD